MLREYLGLAALAEEAVAVAHGANEECAGSCRVRDQRLCTGRVLITNYRLFFDVSVLCVGDS